MSALSFVARRFAINPWIISCAVLGASASWAAPVLINFDDRPGALNYPGDAYAAAGVTFTSGRIPDSISVGAIITVASTVNEFALNDTAIAAVSLPNFVTAVDPFGTVNDVLMSFSSGVTSVQVKVDRAPEGPDIVRLLALAPTGNPFEFSVLAFSEIFDDAVSSPANILAVSNGGSAFSYALFQVTTEAEGFDDLVFNAVPEPGTGTIILLGGLVLGWSRRRGFGAR